MVQVLSFLFFHRGSDKNLYLRCYFPQILTVESMWEIEYV